MLHSLNPSLYNARVFFFSRYRKETRCTVRGGRRNRVSREVAAPGLGLFRRRVLQRTTGGAGRPAARPLVRGAGQRRFVRVHGCGPGPAANRGERRERSRSRLIHVRRRQGRAADGAIRGRSRDRVPGGEQRGSRRRLGRSRVGAVAVAAAATVGRAARLAHSDRVALATSASRIRTGPVWTGGQQHVRARRYRQQYVHTAIARSQQTTRAAGKKQRWQWYQRRVLGLPVTRQRSPIGFGVPGRRSGATTEEVANRIQEQRRTVVFRGVRQTPARTVGQQVATATVRRCGAGHSVRQRRRWQSTVQTRTRGRHRSRAAVVQPTTTTVWVWPTVAPADRGAGRRQVRPVWRHRLPETVVGPVVRQKPSRRGRLRERGRQHRHRLRRIPARHSGKGARTELGHTAIWVSRAVAVVRARKAVRRRLLARQRDQKIIARRHRQWHNHGPRRIRCRDVIRQRSTTRHERANSVPINTFTTVIIPNI